MKSSFQNIIQFGWRYRGYAFLNLIFNALYALFSALSFVSLIPMLNVLFGQTPKVDEQPTYNGLSYLKSYVTDSMNYTVSQAVEDNPLHALMLSIGLILVLFFLKNLFCFLYCIWNSNKGPCMAHADFTINNHLMYFIIKIQDSN